MFGRKKAEYFEAIIADLQEKLANAKKEPEVIEVPVACDCREKLEGLVSNEAELRKEIARLTKLKDKATEDLKTAELDYKIKIEDIKHMQKMLDEKNALEVDRKTFEAEKAAQAEIKKIRNEYAEKLEKELMEERKKMQAVMERVMAALPNVNVKLGGKMGG